MTAATIAHETSTRLRLKLPDGVDQEALRQALAALPGVMTLRFAPSARSVVVGYDGRPAVRQEILARAARFSAAAAAKRGPVRAPTGIPLEAALLAGALVSYAWLGSFDISVLLSKAGTLPREVLTLLAACLAASAG